MAVCPTEFYCRPEWECRYGDNVYYSEAAVAACIDDNSEPGCGAGAECDNGCLADYKTCKESCGTTLASCSAACAGDLTCQAACVSANSSCVAVCLDTKNTCITDCDSTYPECGDNPDPTEAETCFTGQADCYLDNCDRALTTCYKTPTEDLISAIFAANAACITCTSDANSARDTCDAPCTDDYTSCYDGCASDPDPATCRELCLETETTCLCACTEAFNIALVDCNNYTSRGDYVDAIQSCQVTEAYRLAADDGIDERQFQLCIPASMKCQQPCYSDHEAAKDDAHDNLLICNKTCYSGCDTDTDCLNTCTDSYNEAIATADNTFDTCRAACCHEWIDPNGDDHDLQDAWISCNNASRSCEAPCQTLSGTDYTDCIDACDAAYTTCTEGLAKVRSCNDCSNFEGTAYANPFNGKEYDLADILTYCDCISH